jgi:hypothetical protein
MSEFEGDDFSNNLFSDLAPLLTLFGEQVTKQFLSMSMGWADNVLLAMGPLGVITIVVSAIRVGGDKRLRALIGRYLCSHNPDLDTSLHGPGHGRANQLQNRNYFHLLPKTYVRCGMDNRLFD